MDLSTGPAQSWTAVRDASQIGDARRQAKALCRRHGVDEVTAGSVAIVATELATNLIRHGGGGELACQCLPGLGGPVIELLAIDRGPGMADIGRCLQDGYSTGGTAGTGLGAVQRLSTEFDLFSAPGKGTVVLSRLAAAPLPAAPASWGAIRQLAPGESLCGDTWQAQVHEQRARLVVIDGLGHGPLAASAADLALQACMARPDAGPEDLLQAMHAALAGSRGAAAAVCSVDLDSGALRFAGVGNIAATVLVPDAPNRGLVSHNGILGGQVRKIQGFDQVLPQEALLVLASDGLQTRWSLDAYPGLRQRHPALVAALLGRDFRREHDDGTVLALRRSTRH